MSLTFYAFRILHLRDVKKQNEKVSQFRQQEPLLLTWDLFPSDVPVEYIWGRRCRPVVYFCPFKSLCMYGGCKFSSPDVLLGTSGGIRSQVRILKFMNCSLTSFSNCSRKMSAAFCCWVVHKDVNKLGAHDCSWNWTSWPTIVGKSSFTFVFVFVVFGQKGKCKSSTTESIIHSTITAIVVLLRKSTSWLKLWKAEVQRMVMSQWMRLGN